MDDQLNPPANSALSLPLLCAGLAIIAACILMPAAEANKKLVADRDKLQSDLAYVQQQLAVNQQFLDHVGGDPGLAERLAQRQMKVIRQGTSVLELHNKSARDQMSPFLLVSVPRPAEVPAYQPPAGLLGKLCGSARCQLYLTGLGMFMVAGGLVLGTSKP